MIRIKQRNLAPDIALVALFISACAGSTDSSNTTPDGVTTPPAGPTKIDGGEWGSGPN
jgi:hypothetical protein